jgi:hypothetical protein
MQASPGGRRALRRHPRDDREQSPSDRKRARHAPAAAETGVDPDVECVPATPDDVAKQKDDAASPSSQLGLGSLGYPRPCPAVQPPHRPGQQGGRSALDGARPHVASRPAQRTVDATAVASRSRHDAGQVRGTREGNLVMGCPLLRERSVFVAPRAVYACPSISLVCTPCITGGNLCCRRRRWACIPRPQARRSRAAYGRSSMSGGP